MDVGLHDRRIHTQSPAANDALLARNTHHAAVELLDDLGAKRQGESAEGLGIGNLLRSYARKLPIHQVRAHLAFEHAVAPVAHVLEQEQPQHDLRRRGRPPAGAAMRIASGECLVDDLHELSVGEHRIDPTHPLFPQRADFLLDQALGKGHLWARGLDHLAWRRAAGLC